ncbi:hypothetical protein NDU88_001439 [Pleurodeles waltl]|uniref:Uncharacterized protein n=1 Tax=Pleurodeles waltl TaxID=8319 RepID=A0AAV7TJ38_PLEWA|nr:hypothetical protein NDU88_001439 [Pleurodeles waltl]
MPGGTIIRQSKARGKKFVSGASLLFTLPAEVHICVRHLGFPPKIEICASGTSDIYSCAQRIMAQYMDDDQYGEYDAGHYDQHMEERLVEALDFHVQDSVNKALVKALRPFPQPIFNFGVRRFGTGSGNPTPVEGNINEPGPSSNDLLNQTANTVLSDHEYGAFKNCATPSVQTSQHSSDSDASDSYVSPVQDKPQVSMLPECRAYGEKSVCGAPREPQWLKTSHLLPRPRGLVFPKGERPLEKSI